MKEISEILSVGKTDLDILYSQALDIQNQCSDFTVSNVNFKNVHFDGDHCRLNYLPDGSDVSRSSAMSAHSLSQFCNKLGVPVRYIDKCIESGRLDLAEDNINSWVEDYGKNLFIREYQNRIRGVLSDKFSVLDTPDILEVLSDVIPTDDYTIKGHFLTPERFHARITQNTMLDIEGEDLFAGLQIDSSDVGRSVLTVKFMIWKQVCTNGLCISRGGGMLFSQKHIGIDKADFRETFAQSIKLVPDLITGATEMIESARRNNKFSTRGFTEEQMTDFIDRIRFKTKLPEEGVNKVIQFMSEKYGTSTWGLVNSLTEVAQDYTLDRRLEIEKVAGEYLLSA